MKKQSAKTTTVTGNGKEPSRRAATAPPAEGSPADASARVLSFPGAVSGASASPDLHAFRRDRAAESLAEIGLVDREIAAVRALIPVVPIDAELVGRCRAFVTANLAGWDHAAWVAFVEELAAEGYAIGADSGRWWMAQKFVGSLLEAIRAAELAETRSRAARAA